MSAAIRAGAPERDATIPRRHVLAGLASGTLVAACAGSALSQPSGPPAPTGDSDRVLVLANEAVPPEPGTGRKGASVHVAEYYAARRGIPPANIIRLTIPLACCASDPRAWDSWNISWEVFERHIRTPLRRFLEAKQLTDRILYLVSTYGVPLRVSGGPFARLDGISIDSVLAALQGGRDEPVRNPYQTGVTDRSPRFRDWVNPLRWRMYLVTRLDGPSAHIATGLVDKAITAEASLRTTDGIGYFDYRNLAGSDTYARADRTVQNAYRLSVARGFTSVLNDQTRAGDMLRRAPRALWAWGWYSGPQTWEGYEFAEGAVGAQLTSYTATSVRTMLPGTWVPLWLRAGITATWGATGEPTLHGYAMGDNLLNHLWMGYTFGESSYLASPALNHMMVFVGDPLYAPRIFQSAS
jgi:uncharacterized protein (TIGR03790 family)